MEIERALLTKVANKGQDWRTEVGASDSGRSADRARAREPGRGREANTPEQIPLRGWKDILWRVLWSISENRILSTSGSVAFFALLAVFPGIAAIVSLYGLFADASTIGKHLVLLSGFFPGGVLQLIAEQITLISNQGNETLGAAFVVGLLIALGSANSAMAALFDALNVVYDEREKRSLVRFYATTFIFTLAGIVFIILAIAGVVVLPLMLKFVGLATTTESLLAILRWPILLVTIVVSLACIYRYGSEPQGCSLALGHMGEHPRGGALDGSLYDVLLVRRHFRQLQPDVRLPWCGHRLHGLVVDLGGDRSAWRRA